MVKESIRIVAVSDIHLDNRLPYAKPMAAGVTDRLNSQLELLRDIKDKATETKADFIFILGDFFDRASLDPVTLTQGVAALVEMAKEHEVLILPGNHEASSTKGERFNVETFSYLGNPNIGVVGLNHSNPFFSSHWLDMWAIAYCPVGPAKERIDEVRECMNESKTNILLLHHPILGANHLEWTCDEGLDPDQTTEGFDLVWAGHFHTPQEFGKVGRYLGAPMHHHFGDAGRDAGYWVFDVSPTNHKAEFIKNTMPRFHKFSSSKAKVKGAKPGDYLRFEIACSVHEWPSLEPDVKARCEALAGKGYKASFKHKPIHHAGAARLEDESGTLSLKDAIKRYVKATAEGLDKKRLVTLGRDVLEVARHVS
jgi:DNA repair exonuclease SbcCD nuclease subunit